MKINILQAITEIVHLNHGSQYFHRLLEDPACVFDTMVTVSRTYTGVQVTVVVGVMVWV